ncbi:DUF1735 and LamG domain-containing protein [Bacteroides sp. f07]|uniref:BT_3987 domain-containing protein n=1 Tax=Bacteroides sp. f07 TaxID=3132704 RepID=UPI0034B85255
MKNLENICMICSFLLLFCGCKELEMGRDGLLMTGTSSGEMVKFAIDNQDSYIVSVTSTMCVTNDVKIYLDVDENAVETYNSKYGTQYEMAPKEAYELEGKEVVIPAGQSVSSSVWVSIIDKSVLVEGVSYMIPISIKSVDSDMEVIESSRTIYLKLARTILFSAPYVGTTKTSRSFSLDEDDIVTGIRKYTWEVKFKAENFRRNSDGEPIKIGGVYNNMLRFGESGNPTNVLEVYAGTENKMIANTQFAVNTWYLLSIVNDGKTLTLYVNGIKDNSMAVTPYDYQFDGVTIGQPMDGYQSKQLFRGWLGGMRYWSRALSAREIKANQCGVNPNADGLVACYRMDEGTGNIFYDSTPNQRHLKYPDNITINWTSVTNECVE